MRKFGNTSLINSISEMVRDDQMQDSYNMASALIAYRPPVFFEREMEEIHEPIVCNRTRCVLATVPDEAASGRIERCK